MLIRFRQHWSLEGVFHCAEEEALFQADQKCQYYPESGQEFIQGHLNQRVIVQRLGAAFHRLLLHPVAQRSHNAFEKALTVSEKGGVEDDENAPENGQALQENFAVPKHPQEKGKQGQEHKNDARADDAVLGVVGGVKTEHFQRQGSQKRQDQYQLQPDQIKAAQVAELSPSIAFEQGVERESDR